MSELSSIQQLAEHFKISDAAAAAYIKKSSIKVHQLNVGKETMFLYDKAEAIRVIETQLNEERRLAAIKKAAEEAAAAEAAREPSLKEIMAAIKSIAPAASHIEDVVCDLSDKVDKLLAQNVLIFKELQKLTAEPVEIDTTAASGAPQAKRKRMHVAILAAQSNLPTIIGNEYDEALEIEYLQLRSKKLGISARHDKIIMITSSIGAAMINEVKRAAEDRFIRVSGGVSDLRDVLTQLFINASTTTP